MVVVDLVMMEIGIANSSRSGVRWLAARLTDRPTQGTSSSHCALCVVTVAWVGVKEAGLESPNSPELYLVCLVDWGDLQSSDTHTNIGSCLGDFKRLGQLFANGFVIGRRIVWNTVLACLI